MQHKLTENAISMLIPAIMAIKVLAKLSLAYLTFAYLILS